MNIFGRESLKAPFKLPANIVSKAGLRHAGGIKRMLPVMLCLAAAGMALLAGCGKANGKLDPDNPITVGHTFAQDVEPTIDCVDVISFHDYLETRSRITATYEKIVALSEKYNKPYINSELCCLCRSNPYDLALEVCNEYKAGWYVFELMIEGYWSDVHGIVYPDGTIRDPAIVAALFGFYRNNDLSTLVKPNPN